MILVFKLLTLSHGSKFPTNNKLCPINSPYNGPINLNGIYLNFYRRIHKIKNKVFLWSDHHWKKWSHFDLKSWVTGGTKIDTRFRVIEEYLSQIDSILRVKLTIWLSIQLLGIPGRILVPPVTQLFRSKWLHFFFRWSSGVIWSLLLFYCAVNML